ncbi:MAG: hypothetical protein WBG19_03835 [Thermoplasmata archaeon]
MLSAETLGRSAGPVRSLEEITNSFERFSAGLVLLEACPIEQVRAEIVEFESALRAHLRSSESIAPSEGPGGDAGTIASDHSRFLTSIDQLWWFYRIVSSNDHGGHRQALGQYGRLLTEAVQQHMSVEARIDAASSRAPRAAGDAPSGKG